MIGSFKRWLRAPVYWWHYAIVFAAAVAGYWVMWFFGW
jgi:hypothetical protein